MMTCAQDAREIAAAIHAKLDACDNGEGMECASLEASLQNYARSCRDFVEGIRGWAECVFRGQIPFDRDVDRVWQEEGRRLYLRAQAMWQQGKQAEVSCYDLPGQSNLGAALLQLDYILSNWVSPKLAVSPAPRVALQGDLQKMREQVDALPPLPKGWEPMDPVQRAAYRKARSS